MPDRDAFSRAARRLRAAAGNIVAALDGRSEFDPARLAAGIEHYIAAAGGTRTLAALIRQLNAGQYRLGLPGESLTEVAERLALRGSRLDLIAARVVSRQEEQGGATAAGLAFGWAKELLGHCVLEARCGVLESIGAVRYFESEGRIVEMVAPVVERIADRMLEKPDARRINLGFGHDAVSPSEDLL